MVEKKRFDGSDATGATSMLRALRARATASGAVRGVTAAMASVAAMAMLGAVCVTPASALADVNADADASGVRFAAASDGVFCQVGVGRFGVSFSPCERRVSGRFGVGRSCWLLVIALVIA